jgi:1-acyl-sn-glycerol-3-phosphate acyltransferase
MKKTEEKPSANIEINKALTKPQGPNQGHLAPDAKFSSEAQTGMKEQILRSLLRHWDHTAFDTAPRLLLTALSKYFRLELEGTEHLPKRGRCIIAPNHSGFAGLDAVLLGHEILRNTGRIPRLMAHRLWFATDLTSKPLEKMGIVEATTNNGIQLLKKNHLVVLFPEGESGNFKPSSQRYVLQEFRRGFVRMALLAQAPIVPTVIIGAEEASLTLAQIKVAKYLLGSVLPLPLNLIPLPTRWKIQFLEPILLPFKPESANDADLVHDIASDLQERLQLAVNKQLAKRKSIF